MREQFESAQTYYRIPISLLQISCIFFPDAYARHKLYVIHANPGTTTNAATTAGVRTLGGAIVHTKQAAATKAVSNNNSRMLNRMRSRP
jgi:hypothetical protein